MNSKILTIIIFLICPIILTFANAKSEEVELESLSDKSRNKTSDDEAHNSHSLNFTTTSIIMNMAETGRNKTADDEAHNSHSLNFTTTSRIQEVLNAKSSDSNKTADDEAHNSHSLNFTTTSIHEVLKSSVHNKTADDEAHNSHSLNFTTTSSIQEVLKAKVSDHNKTADDEAHNSHSLNFTTTSIRKVIPSSSNYSGQAAESTLSSEDLKIRKDWGGNCTTKDWTKCSKQEIFYGKYEDDDGTIRDDPTGKKSIKCKYLPYWCHKNGWTINKCHILCMSKCSRELLSKLDRYMKHEGECSYL
jgi:hypothetical protein